MIMSSGVVPYPEVNIANAMEYFRGQYKNMEMVFAKGPHVHNGLHFLLYECNSSVLMALSTVQCTVVHHGLLASNLRYIFEQLSM
ncbi:unnamed protein product [Colias eurytheme]|nr:unnamed protein product [Colias eurytheme]